MRFPPSLSSPFLFAAFSLAVAGLRAADTPISFERDIQPILSENCYHCHGPDEAARKAKLRLDRREGALAVGKSGYAAVVPGNPADSELVARIFSDAPDDVMPSPESNRTLTAAQKNLLKRWITEGASFDVLDAQGLHWHWAYRPIARPSPPAVSASSWPRNDVDRFVLARIEAAGLEPAPEADRSTLARRLALDLTGLPPTLESLDLFLADTAPDA